MSDEVKKCPFCGGEVKRIDIEQGENFGGSCVECQQCLACSKVEFGQKDTFIEAWNTRAEETKLRAEVEGVYEYLRGRRLTIEASIAAEHLHGNQTKEWCERAALAEITALEIELARPKEQNRGQG